MPKPSGQRQQATVLPDFVLRQFDRHSSEHDHRQLYRILQTGIRDTLLPAGLKLLPTRVMAQMLERVKGIASSSESEQWAPAHRR